MYEKVNSEKLNLAKTTVFNFFNEKGIVIDENFWEYTCFKLISRNDIYGTELNDNNSKILELRNAWEIEKNFERIKPYYKKDALLNLLNELQKTFEYEFERTFFLRDFPQKTEKDQLETIKNLFDLGRLENILINFSLAYTDDNVIIVNDKLYFYNYKPSPDYKSKFPIFNEGKNAYIEV